MHSHTGGPGTAEGLEAAESGNDQLVFESTKREAEKGRLCIARNEKEARKETK